jgi:outer membrane protein assembly factor BamB
MSANVSGRALAARLAVLVFLAGVLPGWAAAPPQATTFQITIDHAGVTTSGGTLALQNTPLWTVQLPGSISYPLIADGGVFVTSEGIPGVAGNGGSQLYALDAQTGKNLWGPVALPATYTASYLAYDAGTLFTLTSDGVLSSFNVATGAPGWSEQLPGQYAFSSPPTASNGIVYVGGSGSGGTLYAVDEASGTVLWTELVENGDSSSPAVSATGVYVSYPCQVYDFDPVSGTQLWRYNGGCEGGGGRTPVLAGGKLYVRDLEAGRIFDAANGNSLGNFTSAAAPAVTATTAFFLTSDGTLNWFDLQSATQGPSFKGDGSLVSTPIVIDNQVIVGSSQGNLYALDTQSGVLQWQVKAPAGLLAAGDTENTIFFTGVAAANGILVVPAGSALVAYSMFGPPAPANLTATGAPGAIQLSWTASAGATAYNLYMASAAGQESLTPVQSAVVGTSAQITTGLTAGTTYYFTVKRADAAGLSAASNESSAAATAPGAPANLTAQAGVGGVTLSWTATSGATSYSVYQGTSAGSESAAPVLSGLTSPQAHVSSLNAGAKYYFTVKALAYSIASASSNEVSATPQIGSPVNLTATAGTDSVSLSWAAVAGAASYNVYSGTAAGAESATPAMSGIASTTATLSGLTAGTTYYFVVRAVAASATSTPSNEVSAAPVAPAPTDVAGGGGGGAADLLSLLIAGLFAGATLRNRIATSRARVK